MSSLFSGITYESLLASLDRPNVSIVIIKGLIGEALAELAETPLDTGWRGLQPRRRCLCSPRSHLMTSPAENQRRIAEAAAWLLEGQSTQHVVTRLLHTESAAAESVPLPSSGAESNPPVLI